MIDSNPDSQSKKRVHSSRSRLDELVLGHHLACDIQKARSLILSGSILVNDRVETRVGLSIPSNSYIRLKEKIKEYVSRGSYKLLGAFESFPDLSAEGRIALDLGSSTGGFTQVLLEKGASQVIAIDVGYGQLAGRLRNDSRVVVLDRFHIKDLTWSILNPLIFPNSNGSVECNDLLVVCDLSFVSVRLVFDVLKKLIDDRPHLTVEGIALVKPQFETQNSYLLDKGILRDPREHSRILRATLRYFRSTIGGKRLGIKESPILGMDGNKEYLFHYLTSE